MSFALPSADVSASQEEQPKRETITDSEQRRICENASNFNIAPGYQPHPTIIGGYVAKQQDFPYAVRLYVRMSRKIAYCTGQAVTRRLVLSAAHCVFTARDVVIVTGKMDQTDYVRGYNLHKYARYKAQEVFIHPDFDYLHYRHDVAIIKTGRSMMHRGHGFISISFDPINTSVQATIFGWGETEKQRHNHLLFGKSLRAVNCSARMGASDCYRYLCLQEKGICHGDSGGALMVNGVLYGVASFYLDYEDNCTKERYRYYYAAMSEEQNFVKDCIEKNGSNYNRLFFNFTWVFLFYLFIR